MVVQQAFICSVRDKAIVSCPARVMRQAILYQTHLLVQAAEASCSAVGSPRIQALATQMLYR